MALNRIIPAPDARPIGQPRSVVVSTEQRPRQILLEYNEEGSLTHLVGYFVRQSTAESGPIGAALMKTVHVPAASLTPGAVTAINAVLAAIEPAE